VRYTLTLAELSDVIRDRLGEVWSFLREHGISATGHNVVLYEPNADGALVDALFGVEVHEAIPRSAGVLAVETPRGPAAVAIHWGSHDGVPAAHADVRHWCAANGRAITGRNWEVYGDWHEDPAKLRTDVYYELA
jgi:effector-binding domain-containing protein